MVITICYTTNETFQKLFMENEIDEKTIELVSTISMD